MSSYSFIIQSRNYMSSYSFGHSRKTFRATHPPVIMSIRPLSASSPMMSGAVTVFSSPRCQVLAFDKEVKGCRHLPLQQVGKSIVGSRGNRRWNFETAVDGVLKYVALLSTIDSVISPTPRESGLTSRIDPGDLIAMRCFPLSGPVHKYGDVPRQSRRPLPSYL